MEEAYGQEWIRKKKLYDDGVQLEDELFHFVWKVRYSQVLALILYCRDIGKRFESIASLKTDHLNLLIKLGVAVDKSNAGYIVVVIEHLNESFSNEFEANVLFNLIINITV